MVLRDRLHPEDLARGARHQAGAPDLDGRRERPALPGLQRARRAPARRASSRTPTTSPPPTAAAASRTSGPSDRDGVLVATAGHLHPGGLHTDLWVRRQRRARWPRPPARARAVAQGAQALQGETPRAGCGSNAHLFRSNAKYFEPAGAVSWDVAMTGTRRRLEGEDPQGRHALDQRDLQHQARRLVGVDGDHGRLHGRHRARARTRSRSASTTPASRPTATSPRTTTTAAARPGLPDPRKLPDGADVERRAGRHPRLQVRARRPEPGGPNGNPPVIRAGPVGHLPQPRERQGAAVPLDHVVQGAL